MRRLPALLFYVLLVSSARAERPNILIAISDDQSFGHTSIDGSRSIRTPAFDRVAREGLLFQNAICGSPGCSPSRACLLTGRYPWQIEHAGTHASEFPKQYAVFTELLADAGYAVGYTGKGWGPGNWKTSGRKQNPAGKVYAGRRVKKTPGGISRTDYSANFADFLSQRPAGRPFCFWYGCHEPHRAFKKGIGREQGKKLEQATVPRFLPDTPEIRDDLLDYAVEIENFDLHLARMLKQLEAAGELENTLVVVTSDNGMAFPRAKANCYEYGIHLPLAVRWGKGIKRPGRRIQDLVSFVDLAPTFLSAAGLPIHKQMVGRPLQNVFASEKSGKVDAARTAVYSARERHSSSRFGNRAYPQRALRTDQFLLIRNFRPYRWPAGTPRKFNGKELGPEHGGYHDIDACPSLTYLIANRDDPNISRYFHLSVDKRPAWELFDIRKDPDCLNNLIDDGDLAPKRDQLIRQLQSYLRTTHDPRIVDGGDIFESYKRYSRLRKFQRPQLSGPNFVVIMADDLGYGDLSCYGSKKIKTPSIDRLATEGLRFTDFHSSGAVCSPTRAGLLTGRYQQRAGVPGVIFADPQQNRHHGLAVTEVTFADQLREVGYRTAISGKWHLGYEPQFNPLRNGFDLFRGYVSGNVDFISHYDRMGFFDWWHDNKLSREKGYSTHLISKHAVEFIRANRDQPFCLYVAHEAPHSPYQGPGDKPVRGPNAEKVKLTPQFIQRAYREMVEEMDKGVGEIMATLKELELDDNTVVLFFSDNGANKNGSNGCLRGLKGSVWEGGHRVPGIARWPGRIKPGVSNETVITLDVMPTLLSLGVSRLPPGHVLDGVDLSGLLLKDKPLAARTLFWEHGKGRAVRQGPWKLVVPPPPSKKSKKSTKRAEVRPRLFNLAEDLGESRDLSQSQPRRVKSMLSALQAWEEDVRRGSTAQPARRTKP